MATVGYIGQASWDTGSAGQTTHDFGNFPTAVTATLVVMITGAWGTANTLSSVTVDGVGATQQFLSAGQGGGNKRYTAIYTISVTGTPNNDVVLNFGGGGVSGPSISVFVYTLQGIASAVPVALNHNELDSSGIASASVAFSQNNGSANLYACGAFINSPQTTSTWSAATRDAHVADVNGAEWNSAHLTASSTGAHTETNTFNATTNGAGYAMIGASWDTSGQALTLSAAEGAFTLAGQALTFVLVKVGKTLTALNGSFTLTGENATVGLNRGFFQAATGTFTLTGKALTGWGHGVVAAFGSFVLTGFTTILQKNGTVAKLITSGPGLFAVTGFTTLFTRIYGKLIKPWKVHTNFTDGCGCD